MVASCPSLRCSCRKDPVWCREAKGLVTELWFPRFVTMQWFCSQSCYLTAANQWTIVEIELLATVGWKWGCQPSAADVLKMWHTGKRRFARQVCLRNPFPPFLLGISIIHSLPEAGSWERQYAPPALHQLQKRNVSHVKKQSVWSRSCGLQDLLQCSDCALSCAMWLLQTTEQLSRLSF